MMTGTSLPPARSRARSVEAVAVGERHVEQDEVVASLAESFLGDLDAAGDVDGVALERERLLQGGEDRRLVVDDEQMRSSHREKASTLARPGPPRIDGTPPPTRPQARAESMVWWKPR